MLPMEDTRPNVNIYILCLQYNTNLLKKFYTTSNTKIHKHARTYACTHTHTRLTALCLGLPGWAGIRKVKLIWILLKQEMVSGSGISWATCKSAPRSRQITMPAPHHSVFYRPDAVPAAQPKASKHWRQHWECIMYSNAASGRHDKTECLYFQSVPEVQQWFVKKFYSASNTKIPAVNLKRI